MGSIQSQNEMCPACGKEALFTDFYYKSGEEYCCCSHCNYEYSYMFRRDQSGEIIRKNIPYELDGTLVIMTNPFKGEPMDPIPVVGTITKEDVYSILNQDVPCGVRRLYHLEKDKAEPIFFIGDDFEFMQDKQSGKMRFMLKKAIMDMQMRIPRSDGSTVFIQTFQDDDIEMVNQAGQDGALLAETSYLIRREDTSGRNTWMTIEKEKAHQMGEKKLIENIIVNKDGSLMVTFPLK